MTHRTNDLRYEQTAVRAKHATIATIVIAMVLRQCVGTVRSIRNMSTVCKVGLPPTHPVTFRLSRKLTRPNTTAWGCNNQNARRLPNQVSAQVLFCGEELPFSYQYTSEALEQDPTVQVSVKVEAAARICRTHAVTKGCTIGDAMLERRCAQALARGRRGGSVDVQIGRTAAACQ